MDRHMRRADTPSLIPVLEICVVLCLDRERHLIHGTVLTITRKRTLLTGYIEDRVGWFEEHASKSETVFRRHTHHFWVHQWALPVADTRMCYLCIQKQKPGK